MGRGQHVNKEQSRKCNKHCKNATSTNAPSYRFLTAYSTPSPHLKHPTYSLAPPYALLPLQGLPPQVLSLDRPVVLV